MASEILEAETRPASVSRIEHLLETLSSRVSGATSRLDALDATVSMIVESVEGLESRVERVESVARIAAAVGEWKRRTCRYHRDGLCFAWRASPGGPVETRKDESGVDRPDVAKQPVLCAFCPLYEPV